MTPHRDATAAALEPFFAAARADTEAPRLALLSAILADAAAVQTAYRVEPVGLPAPRPPASRRSAAGAASPPSQPARRSASGSASPAKSRSMPAPPGAASIPAESTADQVGAFFDLASSEG